MKSSPITVFTAKKIITMDPTDPIATAVAVRDGKILAVGTLEDLKPWTQNQTVIINDAFKDKIVLPGFIEPHLHPILGALQFCAVWITPEPWSIKSKQIPAVDNHDTYMNALKDAFNKAKDKNKPFITWGYSRFHHGEMNRKLLDSLSDTHPIMVWGRSTHDAHFNSAALQRMQVTAEECMNLTSADFEEGHFSEESFFRFIGPRMVMHQFIDLDELKSNYQDILSYLHYNGITTSADMSTGIFDWDIETQYLFGVFNQENSPLRVLITPDPIAISQKKSLTPQETLAFINHTFEKSTEHIQFRKAIKLFADGAMFSQMMQIDAPGYIDGHEGAWITELSLFEDTARFYWNEGFQIHVHTNGDKGLKRVLDTLQRLLSEKPNLDHRFVIEHYGCSTLSLAKRLASLKAMVSANPFYIYDLIDMYSQVGLGPDRASKIVSLGSLTKLSVPFALHSDFAMAPAEPLFLAQLAVTRQTLKGHIASPEERISLDQALRAITIDAAYILNLDDKLGSIEAGKVADFTILNEDPYAVDVDQLKHITVWGTLFGGRVFPSEA